MSNHFKTVALLATLCIAQIALAQFENNALIPDKNALNYDHVPDRVFVRFLDADNRSLQQNILDEVGGTIVNESKLVPGLFAVEIDVTVELALNILSSKRNSIKYVEPIYIVKAFDTIPNDPMYNNLYGMDQIHAPQAWDNHVGDQEFIIAVIDTGVDYNHQDLVANMWTNPGEIPGNGQDDDGNGYVDDVHGYDFSNYDSDPMDGNGHGTHCSGTIGGVGNNGIGVAGVNWRCRIVGAQFLSSGGSGTIEGAVDAVEYCAINEFKVSNNSWGGGGFSQALFDVIQGAGDQYGHIFVAAAGNGGSYGASYPGALSCTNIICVAATDVNENMASFSQYHPTEVDLGAPGVDVLSSTPGNNYDYYSGTSMATPHVAGGTGLIYSVVGGTSFEEVRDIILSSTRPISSMQGNCATGGVLNVADALANTFLGPQITMLSAVPTEMDPNVGYEVRVYVDPREDTLIDDVSLYYRSAQSDNFMAMPMNVSGLMEWSGTIPGMECDDEPEFYISCEGQTSGTVEHPSGGAANAYGWMIGTSIVSYDDDFNSDQGWVVDNSAGTGNWDRVSPSNGGARCDNPTDADGSGMCYVTGNDVDEDVDDGTTTLTSPAMEFGEGAILSYSRWYSNGAECNGADSNNDEFFVDVSYNGGAWTNLETVGPVDQSSGGWYDVEHTLSGAGTLQVRFVCGDLNSGSVIEAAVDAVSIKDSYCDDVPCTGDANGDGMVGVSDLLIVIDLWGQSGGMGDINGDGAVDVSDLLAVVDAWGACP
ncbi:MAG: S8 family serine peptidase [Phycisphaerae bacterium]|jgi:hypothetical protein|nr:S8 family serine peptidase [Phycisphaerae bacterium]